MGQSKPAEKAQNALAQLELVTGNGKLLTAIRYYTVMLTPGAWTPLKPPRRAGSRDLNRSWKAHLWAVRRILNIPYCKKNDGDCYRLRANYTQLLWSATGLDLDNVLVRQKFEKIPYDFRLNDQLTNAFSHQHRNVLERAKKHLLQHYGRSLIRGEVTPEALERATISQESQQMPIHAPGPTPLTAEPALPSKAKRPNLFRPPTAAQVLNNTVQGFLSKIASGE
jgi:hypothetical protein